MPRTLLAIRCVLYVGGATLVMSGCGSGSTPLDSDSQLNRQVDSGSRPNNPADSGGSPNADLPAFPLAALVCGEDHTSYDDAGRPIGSGYHGACCGTTQCYASEGQPCDAANDLREHWYFGSG